MSFRKTDVVEQIRVPERREFPLDETHGIALWPKHRLIADSRGLGWHDAYTSLATEAPWRRTLPAVPHYCLAYCSNRSASIKRVIDADGRKDATELRHTQLRHRAGGSIVVMATDRAPDIQLVYLRRGMVDQLAEEHFGFDTRTVELVPKLGFSDGLLEQLAWRCWPPHATMRRTASDGIYADHLVRMITLHPVALPLFQQWIERDHRHCGRPTTARLNHVRDLIEFDPGEDSGLERLAAEAASPRTVRGGVHQDVWRSSAPVRHLTSDRAGEDVASPHRPADCPHRR